MGVSRPMGKPILLLRLEGPLQSWGVRSRWSRRDTGPEPTKSGIIGLLGCAAGVLRPDWRSNQDPDRRLEEWDRALRVGVRVERPGSIETDYHTVQGRHWQADSKIRRQKRKVAFSGGKWVFWDDVHTEETWRDYLHDAAFLVALEGEPCLLRCFAGHRGSPRWPLYLGRKCCVASRPVLDRLTDKYGGLGLALMAEPWATPRHYAQRRYPPWPKPPPKVLDAWVEADDGEHERADAMRLNPLRFYDFRRCTHLPVPTEGLAWRIP